MHSVPMSMKMDYVQNEWYKPAQSCEGVLTANSADRHWGQALSQYWPLAAGREMAQTLCDKGIGKEVGFRGGRREESKGQDDKDLPEFGE